MIKYGLVVSDYFKNNRIFDINDKTSNRDNCLYHWILLKNDLSKINIELTTYDSYPLNEYSSLIFSDLHIPTYFNLKKLVEDDILLYLILFESDLIKPNNWIKDNHKLFKKVFLWKSDWEFDEKYIRYYWPNKIPVEPFPINKEREKLCVMIAGNKIINLDHRELYSERINAIRWFENNHPSDFDLFGIDWENGEPISVIKNLLMSNNYLQKIYKRINSYKNLKKILSPFHIDYPSFRNRIVSKQNTLTNYKFAICYENASDIKGYITEKIFDCFFAGCIPIYLGAPDILDYIPSNTFIDKRDFCRYEDLYRFLATMDDTTYRNYLLSIKEYIQSKNIYPFSAESFSEIIINHTNLG